MFRQILSYTKKYPLSYRMIITNICLAVLPILLLGTMGYLSYVHMMKQNALDSIGQIVNQTNDRLDEYFGRMDQLSRSIFYNRNVQQIMIANRSWQESDTLLRNLNSYMSLESTIKSLAMVNADTFRTVSEGGIITAAMMTHIRNKQLEGAVTTRIQYSPLFEMQDGRPGMLAFRQIKSIQQTRYLDQLYIGVMLLDIEWIRHALQTANMDNKASLFIVNGHGEIVGASSGKTGVAELTPLLREQPTKEVRPVRLDDVDYLYQIIPFDGLDWTFVALINKDKLLEKATFIQYTLVGVVVILIAVVVLVVVSFNIRLTHPITKMADAFDRAASGNFDAVLRFGYRNEITVIQDHYNNMLDQIKRLTDHLLLSQKQLHDTEMEKQLFRLSGLQSQINSHFLYNVLHSIRGMSMSGAKKEVASAIDHLVSYFRYITRTEDYVLLFKELEHLDTYIAIQRIRFGKRLQFRTEMEPGLKGHAIVKLILQPLVENALFHGLEGKSGRWLIRVQAGKTEGGDLRIMVMDNGMGMSEEKLRRVREHLAGLIDEPPEREHLGQGIGLENIHSRVRIYYGEPYGLSIKSWEGRGTVVTITIPHRNGEDHNHA
ncbi:two-component sensor histidine kinase [Paenibacillus agaridevorans]|uniref:histidine kinase n=1 Tax=Paenibacillus agaridevorans TaxID=171404 RepID=A0A2R5EXF1_9BACL|nr:histidine kinase [Paenibacillus agaridevorans]GBG08041.1 two-component sensor histidine kinase [Paenibacillus agaridevorans]